MRPILVFTSIIIVAMLVACSSGGNGGDDAGTDGGGGDGAVDSAVDGGGGDSTISDGGSSDGGGGDGGDPFAGLMDVPAGEVRCSGDNCCFRRCWGNEDTLCVSREMPRIIASIDGFGGDASCDQVVFPEWFYNYDCFVGISGIVGPGHPSAAGEPLTVPNVYNADEGGFHLFIECFCGRTATTFASEYSVDVIMFEESCGEPLRAVDDESTFTAFVACDNACVDCVPGCAGRQCGTDGCGGSCGTCGEGESCSASGQCLSSGSGGDSCSSCLSTCRGLTSCCTGCGCICEDACGGCF